MIYSKPSTEAGKECDLYLAFTHLGQYEVHGVLPNGHIHGATIPDLPSVLNKLEYFKQMHCRFPEGILPKLRAQFQNLVMEERQGYS